MRVNFVIVIVPSCSTVPGVLFVLQPLGLRHGLPFGTIHIEDRLDDEVEDHAQDERREEDGEIFHVY